MSRQLSCRGMCKIWTWLGHPCSLKNNTDFLKIWIMSSLTFCKMGSFPGTVRIRCTDLLKRFYRTNGDSSAIIENSISSFIPRTHLYVNKGLDVIAKRNTLFSLVKASYFFIVKCRNKNIDEFCLECSCSCHITLFGHHNYAIIIICINCCRTWYFTGTPETGFK